MALAVSLVMALEAVAEFRRNRPAAVRSGCVRIISRTPLKRGGGKLGQTDLFSFTPKALQDSGLVLTDVVSPRVRSLHLRNARGRETNSDTTDMSALIVPNLSFGVPMRS